MKLAGRADTQVRPYGTDIRQGVVLMRDFCEGPEHP